MLHIMPILIIFYVSIIFYLFKTFVAKIELRFAEKVNEAQGLFEDLIRQKDQITVKRKELEKKAIEIFTLYDMTKEITKKSRAEEAFAVFKSKLEESVAVDECRFIDVESKELEALLAAPDYFVFTLRSKREKLGHFALKGLNENDKDKATILGHQFALALRRVKLYEEIEDLAMTDSLTGAHTRRHFLARFEEELKRSAIRKIDLSLLMVDVDYFKSFNDKFGHLVGDQILREIGRIIKENVREIDIVGRFGGEEFCIVLPVTDRYGANFAAERIRAAVEGTVIKAYDAAAKVTVSIGMATFPVDGKTTAELIDKSDWALYRAKKKGRNCICAFGVYE